MCSLLHHPDLVPGPPTTVRTMLLVWRRCHEGFSWAPEWFNLQSDRAQDRWVWAHILCPETWQGSASCRRQDKEHAVASHVSKQEPSISLPLHYQKGAGPETRANSKLWVIPSSAGLYCRLETSQCVFAGHWKTRWWEEVETWAVISAMPELCHGEQTWQEKTEMASLICLIKWGNHVLNNRPCGFLSRAVIMIVPEDLYFQQVEGLDSAVNSAQACLEHKTWNFKKKFVSNSIFHVKLCSGLFISNIYIKDITMAFRN